MGLGDVVREFPRIREQPDLVKAMIEVEDE
jgi:hypothetical protein